jgi:hypothetical protein
MEIDQWPIVGRRQLVQAFRPGESASREAPFRTLRSHGWATGGISVVTRSDHRASGRFTIFSVLNVDAARLAREGEAAAAAALAKAAARLEEGAAFLRLGKLLRGRRAADVSAAVEGEVPEDRWPELHGALRIVARETKADRARQPSTTRSAEVVTGKISESNPDFLVLLAASGLRTAVPRWLAHSAHREKVGDCLALVSDRLDDRQMVVNAVPGIDVSARAPERGFSPFGRAAPVGRLTRADARLLSRAPAPLRILIPVSIAT